MDLYVSNSILNAIYSYMTWHSLRKQRNVPDQMWRQYYDYACQDNDFRDEINIYWGPASQKISYRDKVLNFIDFMVVCPHVEWDCGMMEILANDKDFVLRMPLLVEKFFGDEDVMANIIAARPYLLECETGGLLRCNRNFILRLLKVNPLVILYITKDMQEDMDILQVAASQMAVKIVEDKKDLFLSIALAIVRQNRSKLSPRILCQFDDEFINIYKTIKNADRITTLHYVKSGIAPYLINPKYFEDKDIALAALRQNSFNAMYFLQGSLQYDREYILECVTQDGDLLALARNFQLDPDIVLCATKQSGKAFRYADKTLTKNKNFVLNILSIHPSLFGLIDDDLKVDVDIMRKILKIK